MAERIPAYDYLRGFAVVLVVLHHASLAYTTFAAYDQENYILSSWMVVDQGEGAPWLDRFQQINDVFFMSLLFFVSGLFCWPSLVRKGGGKFLRERFRRLGIPFLAFVFLIAPLGYYPAYRATEGGTVVEYVANFFGSQWCPGPGWFLWVLLAFSILVVGVLLVAPSAIPALLAWLERRCTNWPLLLFLLLAGTLVAYAPFYLLVPGNTTAGWLAIGPFWVQANRIGIYAFFFFAGVVLGSNNGPSQKLLGPGSPLMKAWPAWIMLALASNALMLFLRPGFAEKAGEPILIIITFSLTCALMVLGVCGLFVVVMNHASRGWQSLAANSYAIYVVHFPIVVGLQVALLPLDIWVGWKFLLVGSFGVGISWLIASLLRRIPPVARIL